MNGNLSNPTPELLEKTENAPIHNMESERTLGMVDAHMRRAPNAKIDLIGAKVKSVKNNTVNWLSSLTPTEQRKIIRSAVHQRRKVANQLKERKQRNLNTAKQRLYELLLKKQTKQTRQMEQKVAKFVAPGNTTTVSDLENEFPTTTPHVLQLAVQLCQDPEGIIGKDCTHLWYDKVKCEMEVYCGSVFEYTSKGKKQFFTLEYWLPGCPEDTHRADLTPKQLLSDLLLGDLLFHE